MLSSDGFVITLLRLINTCLPVLCMFAYVCVCSGFVESDLLE